MGGGGGEKFLEPGSDEALQTNILLHSFTKASLTKDKTVISWLRRNRELKAFCVAYLPAPAALESFNWPQTRRFQGQ